MQEAFNDKVVIAHCLLQYWQMLSLFVICCYYFTHQNAYETSWKRCESHKIFPILHLVPSENNYITLKMSIPPFNYRNSKKNIQTENPFVKIMATFFLSSLDSEENIFIISFKASAVFFTLDKPSSKRSNKDIKSDSPLYLFNVINTSTYLV